MIIIKLILIFVSTGLINGSAFWLAIIMGGMFPRWEGLLDVSLISGVIWVVIGLCFRRAPLTLFICSGPVVPLLFGIFDLLNPFAWNIDLKEWVIKIGAGCVSATITWAILKFHFTKREPGSFPVIQNDVRPG